MARKQHNRVDESTCMNAWFVPTQMKVNEAL